MIERSKSGRGQTIVEFALILPLLVILMLGVIEFGILLYDKAIVTNASREGARAGVVFRADTVTGEYSRLVESEIQDTVRNYLQAGLFTFSATAHEPTITPTWIGTPVSHGGTGVELRVEVRYTYTFLALPRFGNWGSNSIELNATTIMRMEIQD
jgi:hypothetical protein